MGKKLIFLLLVFSSTSFAAGPITHIYFADKCLEFIDINDRTLFNQGNLFPDIRYLGSITREATHEPNVTFEDVVCASSPFQSGTRLHALLDGLREAYVVETGIYAALAEVDRGYSAALLKLIEDELLYDEISSDLVIRQLEQISEEELATGISAETLQLWHWILTQYFKFRPKVLLKKLARLNQPFFHVPAETILFWSEIFPSLVEDPRFIEHVEGIKNLRLEQP